ncbi:hypothetical protein FRAHR75_490006 [Frankia sp. Hr75.2]|nr:hypothetical protein FRAHR75_490006 [Frankia sp. Hr75.2]
MGGTAVACRGDVVTCTVPCGTGPRAGSDDAARRERGDYVALRQCGLLLGGANTLARGRASGRGPVRIFTSPVPVPVPEYLTPLPATSPAAFSAGPYRRRRSRPAR